MSSSKRHGSGGRRQRRQFSPEFKQEAVRLMNERRSGGASLAQIARELEVQPDLLRSWAHRLGQWDVARSANGTPVNPEEELRRLRRELEITRQERDFLKKATAFFAKESR